MQIQNKTTGEIKEFKFDFEKLNVYQKSLDLIDSIFDLYQKLNFNYKSTIGNNLVRAGLSISNNLAEGNGKKSTKDRARFYEYSSDSTKECVSIFNVLERQKLINHQTYLQLRISAREITSMIRGLINKLNN